MTLDPTEGATVHPLRPTSGVRGKSEPEPAPDSTPSDGPAPLLADIGFAAIWAGFAVQRTAVRGVSAVGRAALQAGGTVARALGMDRPPEWLERTADRGRSELRSAGSAAADATEQFAERVIVEFVDRVDVDALLDALDLNELTQKMLENLDVSALVEAMLRRMDVDAVLVAVLDKVDVAKTADLLLERVDLVAVTDTMLERVDVVAITKTVIEGVELGELIRESTGTVAVETVDALRVGGANADRALARLVDRILRRRAERTLELDGGLPPP